MFFKKSNTESNEDAVVKRGIKKMDAMITGAILGGVVAGVYGIKKLKNANEKAKIIDSNDEKPFFQDSHNDENIKNNENKKNENVEKKSEKKWFFARIFR